MQKKITVALLIFVCNIAITREELLKLANMYGYWRIFIFERFEGIMRPTHLNLKKHKL